MMTHSFHAKYARLFFTVFVLLIGSSCGGGGAGAVAPPANPVATKPGGFWDGTWTSPGISFDIDGIITEDGEGRFHDGNLTNYVVTSISGNDGAIQINFNAYAYHQFLDGSTAATGSITGTVVERSTFLGSISFSTGESGTISMNYDSSIYDRDSSLAKISGSWDDVLGTMIVDPDGSLFEQDEDGCVYNGQASIIDAMFNAYRLTMTVSNCGLDNGNYEGIGFLADLNVDGDEVLFIVEVNSNAVSFSSYLERLIVERPLMMTKAPPSWRGLLL